MGKKAKRPLVPPLNILLTNGRFPVALDMARQLKRIGHNVYDVDPMHYHVCKFSTVVKKSFRVPAPHDDGAGYVAGVKNAVKEAKIDLIIPLHEEIFYLAECGDREILDRLFAPPFKNLIRMHDKWEFSQFLKLLGLDFPHSVLCQTYKDVQNLDHSKEWALKPVFGRACSNVFHLKPGKDLPTEEEMSLNHENVYIAQEWVYGTRYCSYSVFRDGQQRLLSVYPVKDTIDGSSCVYFESAEHQGNNF
jgi:predicted ATP-grasp superfamily ATP-dependent carboligase